MAHYIYSLQNALYPDGALAKYISHYLNPPVPKILMAFKFSEPQTPPNPPWPAPLPASCIKHAILLKLSPAGPIVRYLPAPAPLKLQHLFKTLTKRLSHNKTEPNLPSFYFNMLWHALTWIDFILTIIP